MRIKGKDREVKANANLKYQVSIPVDIAIQIDQDARSQCRPFAQQLEFILRETYMAESQKGMILIGPASLKKFNEYKKTLDNIQNNITKVIKS
jgi:hypothetical protein